MDIYKNLPSDIIHQIIEYTGKLKRRNGKYMNQIDKEKYKYEYKINPYSQIQTPDFETGKKYFIQFFYQTGSDIDCLDCIGRFIRRKNNRVYFDKFRLQAYDESYSQTTYLRLDMNQVYFYKIK